MRRVLTLTTLLVVVLAPPAVAGTRLYIKGRGYGHGVGMSQYGAQGYALHGWGYAAILRHYYQGTALGQVNPSTRIRVQLASPSSLTLAHMDRANKTKLNPSKTYVMRRSGARLQLLTSAGKSLGRYHPTTFRGYHGYFYLGNRQLNGHGPGDYRGTLSVTATSSGVSAVNVVSLDDYARAVVPSEVPTSWDPDALRVQAVAARTYALTTGVGHTLYPDTRSQMYSGMSVETPATSAAVKATRGQVVTYHGAPIVTYYFSTSGGRTENVENVFGGSPEPYLRSVEDRYDSIAPLHKWTKRMSLSSAGSELRGLYSGSLRTIKVLERGKSPRIVRARVVGSRGSSVTDGSTLRSRLSAYDSWMYFYLVTAKGTKPAAVGAAVHGAAGAGTVPERISRTRLRGLAGSVRGAPRGARAKIQRLRHGRWTAADRVPLGRGGTVRWTAPQAGTYRVTWGGMPSDAVALR
ncbi:MAG TPA: SpoIID/LytB domain-containing protein [Solirubrobacteraceae bacterium]